MAIGARESKARLDTVSAKPLKEVCVFGSSIPQGVIHTITMLRKAGTAEGTGQTPGGVTNSPPAGVARRRLEEFFRRID